MCGESLLPVNSLYVSRCPAILLIASANRTASGNLIPVFIFAMIEPESLLIHIAEQVKWFHADIGSIQAALQQTPEVLDSLSMHSTINVPLKMVHDLVRIVVGDCPRIHSVLIGVDHRASVNR